MRSRLHIWLIAVALITGAAIPASAQRATRVSDGFEVEIEHRFTVTSRTTSLEIENYAGDVRISGSDGRDLILVEVVYVNADDEHDALERARNDFSGVVKNEETITIRGAVRREDDRLLRVTLASGMPSRVSGTSGDLSFTNATGSTELRTGSGDISVRRAGGSVDARTGSGDITAYEVEGVFAGVSGAGDVTLTSIRSAVDVTTGAGDLELRDIRGPIEAATGGGDIGIEDVTGDVVARTAGGDIELRRIDGQARLSTSGGSIEASRITGNLDATTLGGDIEIEYVDGVIAAATRAGDVDLRRVRNSVFAETDVGEITVSVENAAFLGAGVIELRAENGNIDLRLPTDARAELVIDLGFDGVFEERGGSRSIGWTERRNDVSQGRVRRIAGKLNGGGGRIELHTDSGDISVRAN